MTAQDIPYLQKLINDPNTPEDRRVLAQEAIDAILKGPVVKLKHEEAEEKRKAAAAVREQTRFDITTMLVVLVVVLSIGLVVTGQLPIWTGALAVLATYAGKVVLNYFARP